MEICYAICSVPKSLFFSYYKFYINRLKILALAASAASFTMAVHTETRPHAEHRKVALRHPNPTRASAATAAVAGGVGFVAGYAANELKK